MIVKTQTHIHTLPSIHKVTKQFTYSFWWANSSARAYTVMAYAVATCTQRERVCGLTLDMVSASSPSLWFPPFIFTTATTEPMHTHPKKNRAHILKNLTYIIASQPAVWNTTESGMRMVCQIHARNPSGGRGESAVETWEWKEGHVLQNVLCVAVRQAGGQPGCQPLPRLLDRPCTKVLRGEYSQLSRVRSTEKATSSTVDMNALVSSAAASPDSAVRFGCGCCGELILFELSGLPLPSATVVPGSPFISHLRLTMAKVLSVEVEVSLGGRVGGWMCGCGSCGCFPLFSPSGPF